MILSFQEKISVFWGKRKSQILANHKTLDTQKPTQKIRLYTDMQESPGSCQLQGRPCKGEKCDLAGVVGEAAVEDVTAW